MKVLMLNGSSNKKGNTNLALEEIGKQLENEGLEYEIFQMGGNPVRDCIGCGMCSDKGCTFSDDKVNEFVAKAKEADGFIFGTPVYYAHPSGRVLSFLDRVFFSSGAFDVMNKYFGISQMPVVGSTYWNIAHGCLPGEAAQDAEGLQTMRNLARNMAWMIKSLKAAEAAGVQLPQTEDGSRTNFIR